MSETSRPVSESLVQRLVRRIGWGVRGAWPDREVRRVVQGVAMVLPWSHRLPDYARVFPEYGQNLVRLAELLAGETPLTVLDVGANVGDSTLQILDVADARVLCVEADAYFLRYLRSNVDGDPRVAVEPALLQAPSASDVAMAPVRVGGTTRFAEGTSTETLPTISTAALRDKHPDFTSLRLAKSDTDGYDVELIPAIARTWSDSRPVLFFEYDHVLSRVAGNDPVAVWPALAELGYTEVAVWDNWGLPVGRVAVEDMPTASAPLDLPGEGRAHPYWDVAVVHGEDGVGLAALEQLVPQRL